MPTMDVIFAAAYEKIKQDPVLLEAAFQDLNGTVERVTGEKLSLPWMLRRTEDGVIEIWPIELFNAVQSDTPMDELSDDLLDLVSAGSTKYCNSPNCPTMTPGQTSQG